MPSPGHAPTPPAPADRSTLASLSLVLGILSLCAWILSPCGFPISIVGLILDILSVRSKRRDVAIAGIVLAALTPLAAVVNAAFGALPRPDRRSVLGATVAYR
jgi:hypothetical protein